MNGKGLSAKDVLLCLIDECFCTLDDLKNAEAEKAITPIQFGVRTATVAYLEILQQWEEAAENGLDFDIEAEYPV